MQQKLLKKSHILGWYWLNRITVISWNITNPREVTFQVTLTVTLFSLC